MKKIILKATSFVMTTAALLLAPAASAQGAFADDGPQNLCPKANTSVHNRPGPASLPPYLFTMEIEFRDHRETIISSDIEHQDGYDQDPQIIRNTQLEARMMEADSLPEGSTERKEKERDAFFPPPEGRYKVLAIAQNRMHTPSTIAEERACSGEVTSVDEAPKILSYLHSHHCGAECSGVTKEDLIDHVFLPDIEKKRVRISGRKSYSMKTMEDPARESDFITAERLTFDASDLVEKINGEDGAFHPEEFEATVEVREMRPRPLKSNMEQPLVLSVQDVEACPDMRTAESCAPNETRIRENLGYEINPSLRWLMMPLTAAGILALFLLMWKRRTIRK